MRKKRCDAAHDAFMALPAYAQVREGEVRQLSRGSKLPCPIYRSKSRLEVCLISC